MLDDLNMKKQSSSLTIQAAVVVILVGIANVFGWALSEQDAAELWQLLTGAVATVTGMLAWYGRVRATKRIAPLPAVEL